MTSLTTDFNSEMLTTELDTTEKPPSRIPQACMHTKIDTIQTSRSNRWPLVPERAKLATGACQVQGCSSSRAILSPEPGSSTDHSAIKLSVVRTSQPRTGSPSYLPPAPRVNVPPQGRLGTSSRARCSPRQVPDRREASNSHCPGLSWARGAERDRQGRGQGQGREPCPSPRRQPGAQAERLRRGPLRSARACGAPRGRLWPVAGGAALPPLPRAPLRLARPDPALGRPGALAPPARLQGTTRRARFQPRALSPRPAARRVPGGSPASGRPAPTHLPAASLPGPLASGCLGSWPSGPGASGSGPQQASNKTGRIPCQYSFFISRVGFPISVFIFIRSGFSKFFTLSLYFYNQKDEHVTFPRNANRQPQTDIHPLEVCLSL